MTSHYFDASIANLRGQVLPSTSAARFDYEELASALWGELAAGRCVVREVSHSATHCLLQVERCAAEPTEKDHRHHECLRRVLVGEAPKEVAFARNCSPSTVASAVGDSLSKMGLKRGLLYVPYLLVRAAHVASGFALPPLQVRLSAFGDRWQVSVERPELRLKGLLTATECEVVGLMLEGHSNAAIALRRGVSTRTVANQISSISHKLGTSGRVQLLRVLARGNEAHSRWRRESGWSATRDAVASHAADLTTAPASRAQ
jgi:DNA-binding CsgD family transcriptional regulator